ncbi:hypothetical protein GDO81_003570 [Engystomops pustulosus]|uniref:Uncharacterized protein n=1 Tax=Engystomops pustulosus TaxID=76066 RepID=A0AAV7A6K2_ENGPU|nr:hypothetical protein GDO81_003570 [Engystomops pustulosus]
MLPPASPPMLRRKSLPVLRAPACRPACAATVADTPCMPAGKSSFPLCSAPSRSASHCSAPSLSALLLSWSAPHCSAYSVPFRSAPPSPPLCSPPLLRSAPPAPKISPPARSPSSQPRTAAYPSPSSYRGSPSTHKCLRSQPQEQVEILPGRNGSGQQASVKRHGRSSGCAWWKEGAACRTGFMRDRTSKGPKNRGPSLYPGIFNERRVCSQMDFRSHITSSTAGTSEDTGRGRGGR